jgi:hypothetical protein
MSRPKFVPINDTLEPRNLLSGFNLFATTKVTTPQLSSFLMRLQRIERLPNFLETISPGRPLPRDIVVTLQSDLRSTIARLHPATQNGLYTYNRDLRGLLSSASVHQANIEPVLALFAKNLQSAGLAPALVQSLSGAVKQLAQVTVNTVAHAPSVVASDTSLVLELALAVGKPLPAPKVPHLALADGISGHPGFTRNPRPTLVGVYEPAMTMYVMNFAENKIFGSSPTDGNGNYRVTLSRPLQQGHNVLKIAAIGPGGIASISSFRFGINLLPPHPR